MTNSTINIILRTLDIALIKTNGLKDHLFKSKFKTISNNAKILADLVITGLFSWVFGSFVYILVLFIKAMSNFYLYVLDYIVAIINMKKIVLMNTLILLDFDYKNFMCTMLLTLICTLSLVLINLNNTKFSIHKEFCMIVSIIRNQQKYIKINKWTFIFFFVFTVVLYSLTVLLFPNIQSGYNLAFWSSVFVLIFTYGSLNENEIRAKKFALYIFIIPIAVANSVFYSKIQFSEPIQLIFLVITMYFILDRAISSYIDYRKYFLEGNDLAYTVINFETDFYNDLDKKHRLWSFEIARKLDKLTLAGLIAYHKSDRDCELARVCLEEQISCNSSDNVAIFYLGQLFLNSDEKLLIEKSLKLFTECKRLQDTIEVEVRFVDINNFIVRSHLMLENTNYDEMLDLLNSVEIPDQFTVLYKTIIYIETIDESKCKVIESNLAELEKFTDFIDELNYCKDKYNDYKKSL